MDIEGVALQQKSVDELQSSTDKLKHFNDVSEARYGQVKQRLQSHVKLIEGMKSDLDSIHRTIRHMKKSLSAQYPEEMKTSKAKYPDVEIPDDG
ncbi:hypothetical protein BZG36_02778 [Bifiguratus adelaidae]|uniref:KxDL domain-containing protein n=1 Tax=Bifiguratus adelaidae TaxID=1938954 RepID=A0A261Y1U5_9FUNG|nr:hypothetical protein BZG36_02778 [Bifiguratus adelaidae]